MGCFCYSSSSETSTQDLCDISHFIRSDFTDDSNIYAGSELTEWEKEKERDEFVRAAALFKPLSSVMASRFTSAKHKDDDDATVAVLAQPGVNDVLSFHHHA